MVTHQTRSAISKSVGSTGYEILDGHRRDLVSLLSQKKETNLHYKNLLQTNAISWIFP